MFFARIHIKKNKNKSKKNHAFLNAVSHKKVFI